MRTFEHFPEDVICKLCGTSEDKPCCLCGIDETSDGHIEEAIPIHVDCINLRFNQNAGIFYQRKVAP